MIGREATVGSVVGMGAIVRSVVGREEVIGSVSDIFRRIIVAERVDFCKYKKMFRPQPYKADRLDRVIGWGVNPSKRLEPGQHH